MLPVIINGRWSLDGIAVPYADFFSLLVFRIYIKRAVMMQPLLVRATFRSKPEEIKKKYNYVFNFKNR